MKKKLKLKKLINTPLSWLRQLHAFLLKNKSTIELIVAVAALLLAIDASRLSRQALKDSEENSKRADSMFTVQLQIAEELNDKIIANLDEIQGLTDKQLEITNQQLDVSNQSLIDQKISGRPVIILDDTEFISFKVSDDTEEYKFFCTFQNTGKRFAYDIRTRSFIVSPNFKRVLPFKGDYIYASGPNNIYYVDVPCKFRGIDLPIYFVSEVTYYDKFMDKEYHTTDFYEYLGNGKTFAACDERKIQKLTEIINIQTQLLKDTKLRLSD